MPSAGNYVAEDVTETCVAGSAAADPHRCLQARSAAIPECVPTAHYTYVYLQLILTISYASSSYSSNGIFIIFLNIYYYLIFIIIYLFNILYFTLFYFILF